MDIITSYYTDSGRVKQVNQDSFLLKVANSNKGRVVFAMICDGMGGLVSGELASKEAVRMFNNWFTERFAACMMKEQVTEEFVRVEWNELIRYMNHAMRRFAEEKGIKLGTTLTALLMFQRNYYICHIGDSRIYRIGRNIHQLTQDHTLVEWEMRMGMLSEREMENDPRRNVLLQCMGGTERLEPQFECGVLKGKETFILCTDGLVHYVSKQELLQYFRPKKLKNKAQVASACKKVSELAMQRGETDNVTVLGIVCV